MASQVGVATAGNASLQWPRPPFAWENALSLTVSPAFWAASLPARYNYWLSNLSAAALTMIPQLCPCINCFPDFITDFLHKIGICEADLRAELFSKVYLVSKDTKSSTELIGWCTGTRNR